MRGRKKSWGGSIIRSFFLSMEKYFVDEFYLKRGCLIKIVIFKLLDFSKD